ncbi:MAG: hypothetical protein WCG75_09735 [Armatimonadota bacterium]
MTRQPWFRLVALCGIFILVGISFWPIPEVSRPSLVAAGISFILAIALRFRQWRDDNRDPYSLSNLNSLIRDGTYEESDVPDADSDGDKYCINCHHAYGAHFGVCPRCGR